MANVSVSNESSRKIRMWAWGRGCHQRWSETMRNPLSSTVFFRPTASDENMDWNHPCGNGRTQIPFKDAHKHTELNNSHGKMLPSIPHAWVEAICLAAGKYRSEWKKKEKMSWIQRIILPLFSNFQLFSVCEEEDKKQASASANFCYLNGFHLSVNNFEKESDSKLWLSD